MFYAQNGNGGTMSLSSPVGGRNIVVVSNDAVALCFQGYMEHLRVGFELLEQVPQNQHLEWQTTTVLSDEEDGRQFLDRLERRVMSEFHSRKPKRRFRRR